jgi:hypothetical protein
MPNTRVIDYVVLIQDNIMSIQDVPADIRDEVAKWLKYFQTPIQKTDSVDKTTDDLKDGGVNEQ